MTVEQRRPEKAGEQATAYIRKVVGTPSAKVLK